MPAQERDPSLRSPPSSSAPSSPTFCAATPPPGARTAACCRATARPPGAGRGRPPRARGTAARPWRRSWGTWRGCCSSASAPSSCWTPAASARAWPPPRAPPRCTATWRGWRGRGCSTPPSPSTPGRCCRRLASLRWSSKHIYLSDVKLRSTKPSSCAAPTSTPPTRLRLRVRRGAARRWRP